MFKRILIANRGEIACRIIRTCRRMGIETVAVYSEADEDSLAVRNADSAVCIGSAPARESYLRPEKIIEACRQTKAEAVHPGFGFLSENADFARALQKAGIAFIGPSPAAIDALGDKIAAKKLALKAGVSVVPGKIAALDSPQTAINAAREIGFPIIIKASAGGGGKGMRIVRNAGEMADALRLAASEAQSSFGDPRVFIEKYIERPRHIEIQLIGDQHGNILYLAERECSLQRRHQKVIEEAPSPVLTPALRQKMGEQAVSLARLARYASAGTVEFILDARGNFYFLEMNTRLQVEHPVTEEITGLDLVELMIRVAAGEKLRLKQKDIRIHGHAIEARLYAEDPARNFMPSIGRLRRCRFPSARAGLRIETGVEEGAEISIHYDPMIAKLIAHGKNRAEATARLARALDEMVLAGVTHNIPFLSALLHDPAFAKADFSTGFIGDRWPEGYQNRPLPIATENALCAVAVLAEAAILARAGQTLREGVLLIGKKSLPFQIAKDRQTVTLKGQRLKVENDGGEILILPPLFCGKIGGKAMAVKLTTDHLGGYRLLHAGATRDVHVLSMTNAAFARRMPTRSIKSGGAALRSPMPGLLVSLAVRIGDAVKAGQEIAVVEAMKMENILRAEKDARVKTIAAKPGDTVTADQMLVEFG